MVKEIFTQKSGSFTTTPQHELSEFKIELAEGRQGLQEALLSKACQGTLVLDTRETKVCGILCT